MDPLVSQAIAAAQEERGLSTWEQLSSRDRSRSIYTHLRRLDLAAVNANMLLALLHEPVTLTLMVAALPRLPTAAAAGARPADSDPAETKGVVVSTAIGMLGATLLGAAKPILLPNDVDTYHVEPIDLPVALVVRVIDPLADRAVVPPVLALPVENRPRGAQGTPRIVSGL